MKRYIDKLPQSCPKCGSDKLEADTDPVKGGYLNKLVCEDCGYEVDWYFVSDQEAEEDWNEFLEENS